MATTYFTSEGHKTRFISIQQQLNKLDAGKFDREYSTALYILTSDLATWEKASGYVSRHGIDFEGLLQEVDFSHGYIALIELAGNLFNAGYTKCSPVDLYGLDDRNFHVAMTAFLIRRNGWRIEEAG